MLGNRPNEGAVGQSVPVSKYASCLLTEALPALPNRDDYRRLAARIRDLACLTHLTVAQDELLRVATNYERRAELIERLSTYW